MGDAKTGLLEELRTLKAQDTKRGVDWNARKLEWLADLDQLFKDIREWLDPGVQEGLITIHDGDVGLSEEYLGAYVAPRLRVAMAAKVVDVVPVGTLIIGAAGRVDLTCGGRTAVILRTGSRQWKFRSAAANATDGYVDVTDESFSEAIRELIR